MYKQSVPDPLKTHLFLLCLLLPKLSFVCYVLCKHFFKLKYWQFEKNSIYLKLP